MKKCLKCNGILIKEDESFTHEFGTEILIYYTCEECNILYSQDLEVLEE